MHINFITLHTEIKQKLWVQKETQICTNRSITNVCSDLHKQYLCCSLNKFHVPTFQATSSWIQEEASSLSVSNEILHDSVCSVLMFGLLLCLVGVVSLATLTKCCNCFLTYHVFLFIFLAYGTCLTFCIFTFLWLCLGWRRTDLSFWLLKVDKLEPVCQNWVDCHCWVDFRLSAVKQKNPPTFFIDFYISIPFITEMLPQEETPLLCKMTSRAAQLIEI